MLLDLPQDEWRTATFLTTVVKYTFARAQQSQQLQHENTNKQPVLAEAPTASL